jgi:hypothetical protein
VTAPRPDRIVLLGYPVELGIAVTEHVEEWMREFKLIALSRGTGDVGHAVPDRLMQTVQMLSQRYASELSGPDRMRAAAAARGDATVDLTYPVRPESEATVLGWKQLTDEVDDYCRAEELLTLQRTPEQIALQDWVCEEFLRQLRGEPPRPWSDHVAQDRPGR